MSKSIQEMRAAMAATNAARPAMAAAGPAPHAQPAIPAPPRIVGAKLAYGLLFLPVVFVWEVFKPGYSGLARALSATWAVLFALSVLGSAVSRQQTPTLPQLTAATGGERAMTFAEVSEQMAAMEPVAPAAKPAATPPAPKSAWSYRSDTDEMRGTTTRYAETTATNSAQLGFPYDKETPRLIVRDRPSDGLAILLAGDAQFVCSEYSRDYVSVKFDDGPIQNYSCSEPMSAASDVIFIENEKKFLTALKDAKQVMIEVMYFNHGAEQFKFAVSDLEW